MTTRYDHEIDKKMVDFLMKRLPKEKLTEFRESLKKRIVSNNLEQKIVEFNPPRDGVAYSCKDMMHVTFADIYGRPMGGFAKFERYWDKDGNCIGFEFRGKKYMFDKEKQSEQGRDTAGQGFRDGQNRILSKVPENSELAKYLAQYPDAILTPDSKWGWITKLPEGSYPELKITAQRIKVWDKNGRYMSVIKGMQKEM